MLYEVPIAQPVKHYELIKSSESLRLLIMINPSMHHAAKSQGYDLESNHSFAVCFHWKLIRKAYTVAKIRLIAGLFE